MHAFHTWFDESEDRGGSHVRMHVRGGARRGRFANKNHMRGGTASGEALVSGSARNHLKYRTRVLRPLAFCIAVFGIRLLPAYKSHR